MRIPGGDNFGNQVASNPGGPQISAGQLDGGIGRAVQGLAATVDNIGDKLQFEQKQKDAQLKQDSLYQVQQEVEARKAADKAQATARVGQARDGLDDILADIDDGVSTGRIDKTKAGEEYRTRSAKLLTESMQGLPKDYQPIVQNEISSRSMRLENKVGQIVRKRDQADTLDGLNQTLEYAQRLSLQDPKAARDLVTNTVDQLGPFAGLNPAAAGKLKQTTLEQISYTRAYTAVNMARTDNGALSAAAKQIGQDTDIDPQKQAQLLTTISGFQAANDQRAEAAAARAQRQQEAALKRAEAAYNVFQTTADHGTMLDPAFVEKTAQMTAGTPYAEGVRQLAAQAQATGGLAAQPIQQQRVALDDLNKQIATNGANPALLKRRDQQEKVLRGSETDLGKDGLRAALERGVITNLAPLDLSSMQTIASGLQARLGQSQDAAQWAGRAVSPLTSDEADKVGSVLNALPAAQKGVAIATLAGALGPTAAGAVAAQLNDKDRGLALAMALSTDKTTTGRYTSQLLLAGQQAKKDGTSTKGDKQPDVKAANWRAEIAASVEGAFPSEDMRKSVIDAAELISHGMAAEQGGDLSKDDRQRAIRLAVSGNFIQHNGRPLPLPAGVDEDRLDARLQSVTPAEIKAQAGGDTVRAGGVDVPIADFVKKLPGQQLMIASQGKYMVLVDGRPVTNAARRPIIIGVN